MPSSVLATLDYRPQSFADLRHRHDEQWCLLLPEPSLLLVAGLPGSGKTTLLQRCLADPHQVISAENEVIRANGADVNWKEVMWGRAISKAMDRATSQLYDGKTAILESVGLHRVIRLALTTIAAEVGITAHLLWLDASPEEARAGQVERNRVLPAERWDDYCTQAADFDLMLEKRDKLDSGMWDSITILSRASAGMLREIKIGS